MSDSAATVPGPVSPRERMQSLDVARGVAILGVLLMNIWAFAGPQAFFDYPLAISDRAGAPVATWAVIHTLFEGSQRTLLSILFGAGAMLSLTRLGQAGQATARRIYYRRTAVLIALGLMDAFVLMWPADILFVYGLAGLCLYPLHRLRTSVLLAVALTAMAVPAGLRSVEIAELRTMEAAYSAASAARQGGHSIGAEDERTIAAWETQLRKARPSAADDSKQSALATMQSGTVAQIAVHQAGVSLILQTVVALKWWFLDALAMMTIGMILCRHGLLTRPQPAMAYAWMIVGGFAVGLPLATWQTQSLLATDFHPLQVALTKLSYDVRRLGMGLGYLGLVLWFCRAAGGQWLKQPLAAAGRLALTNYLGQSVLCGLIFYGFGLGLYGRLSGYQLYYVVALVWAVELTWSVLWLRYFRIGPWEWVWRSLMYGRLQDWRRRREPALTAAAAAD